MKKVFYFIQHSGQRNQIGEEYNHWDVSFGEYPSKKALQKARSQGSSYVRMNEIYTPQQLINCFSKAGITQILQEIKRYRPDLVNKARQQAQKSSETPT